MSRVGKMPVPVPEGVTVSLTGQVFQAKGPLGELAVNVPPSIGVKVEDKEVVVTRPSNAKPHRSLHGLTRSLVNSAVVGVSKGFEKRLEIVGVGYRAEMKGKNLVMHVGFSHPITIEPPKGLEVQVPDQSHVVVKGADKQAVGQLAAIIRELRPPEPYKGKGVKYEGEHIRRKAGKTAAG